MGRAKDGPYRHAWYALTSVNIVDILTVILAKNAKVVISNVMECNLLARHARLPQGNVILLDARNIFSGMITIPVLLPRRKESENKEASFGGARNKTGLLCSPIVSIVPRESQMLTF
jgi:hypothetical protein